MAFVHNTDDQDYYWEFLSTPVLSKASKYNSKICAPGTLARSSNLMDIGIRHLASGLHHSQKKNTNHKY
jgi:hypothetical protein